MRTFSRTVILLVALSTLAFFTVLLFPSCSKKTESKEIKIGVVLPLTGDASIYGKALKNGIDLAFHEHSFKDDFVIKLVFEDDQYSPNLAVSAIQKLIQVDKVPAIIGGAGSTTAEPVIPICDRNKVVLLSPCATAPSLSGVSSFFFRLWPSDNYDGTVMADTAYIKLNIRKIAVLFINAPYGQGITKVFTEKFESLGGNISITESYTQGATDYRTQLTKIKDTGVKWVFVPGYVKEIVNILKQAQELALDVRFLGVNSMYDPKLLEIAGETAEGSVFSIPTYDPNSEEPIIRKFVASYKAAYDSEPDAFAATGYDAMRVMLEAIKLGGGTTGLGIQKGMMLIKDFTGPSGVVTFDKNGDVNKPLRLMTVRNGRFVSLGGEL